jgi:hypothetical protein
MGLDVGPDAIKTSSEALDTCNTIIWNGPMGVFEFEKFAAGTDVSTIDSHPLISCIFFLFSVAKHSRLSSGNCQEVG